MPHKYKSARHEPSTCRTTTRAQSHAPKRIAQFEAKSAPIDLSRWRLLWDRLLAPPVPRDSIATPLAAAQTSTTKASPKNLGIGGGGHV